MVAKSALIMLNFLLKTRQKHCAVYTHMGNETCARALKVASGVVAKHAYIYPEFAHNMHLQCCENLLYSRYKPLVVPVQGTL